MVKKFFTKYLISGLLLLITVQVQGKTEPDLSGKWSLIPASSSQLLLYHTASLRIESTEGRVNIIQKWGKRFTKTDTLNITTNGTVNFVPVDNRVWPTQVFMGVSMIPGSNRRVTAEWIKKDRILKVEETYPVLVSQGRTKIHTTSTYSISADGKNLTLKMQRNTRPDDTLQFVFGRTGAHTGYYMRLKNNWKIDGLLPQNAFLISLQGIVNTNSPNLYFIYPDDWDFRFSPSVFDFYRQELGYSFTKLSSIEKSLKTFRKKVEGYVVWDPAVRTSLNIAFTVAGLEKAVVVSPDMIPMVKEAGLKQVADFRGRFKGMTDAQIFSWAYDKYWERTNNKYVIWMGGVSGNRMEPGIADFGISKGSFFADLSTAPEDTTEYDMANKIFRSMEPLSMVMGWHSYAKDLERDYVRLTSSYGLRVEGLNSFPNLSFTSRTPTSPEFEFKNNFNVERGRPYSPKKKVYIACIQTDGLGLGAWTKPGRGSIPYAWEVTINWQWMAPTMLEFYYSTATEKDLFIGALSGPGYMYPKAIPKEYLPKVISEADNIMKKLDLNIFETMDYAEGSTVTGNTELPKYIVDSYYKYMPDAIGFVNGYSPSYTFASKNGRPFVSYDYYLDEERPVKKAVKDLEELATLNQKRPYFLLMHVREWNNIDRVKEILDKLSSEFEVVPLDIFLKMAGQKPTFKTRFLDTERVK